MNFYTLKSIFYSENSSRSNYKIKALRIMQLLLSPSNTNHDCYSLEGASKQTATGTT
jgi:hypothetical protein